MSLVSLVPITHATDSSSGPPSPQLVATVMVLEPRGLALIQTAAGATYEVIKGTAWHTGDTVECAQYDVPHGAEWQALDCWKARY
jgi:hypothetical protein